MCKPHTHTHTLLFLLLSLRFQFDSAGKCSFTVSLVRSHTCLQQRVHFVFNKCVCVGKLGVLDDFTNSFSMQGYKEQTV